MGKGSFTSESVLSDAFNIPGESQRSNVECQGLGDVVSPLPAFSEVCRIGRSNLKRLTGSRKDEMSRK